MSSQAANEVLRARTSLVLPPERVRDILPDAPGPAVAALPKYASLFPDGGFRRFAAGTQPSDDPLNPVPGPMWGGASNAWAAGPSRSASGGTLLANDPHLPFTAPSLWYLARLQLQSGGVIGATMPGIPAVLLGRSQHFGWGMTSAWIDDEDLHVEELDPKNPERVRHARRLTSRCASGIRSSTSRTRRPSPSA